MSYIRENYLIKRGLKLPESELIRRRQNFDRLLNNLKKKNGSYTRKHIISVLEGRVGASRELFFQLNDHDKLITQQALNDSAKSIKKRVKDDK